MDASAPAVLLPMLSIPATLSQEVPKDIFIQIVNAKIVTSVI